MQTFDSTRCIACNDIMKRYSIVNSINCVTNNTAIPISNLLSIDAATTHFDCTKHYISLNLLKLVCVLSDKWLL